MKKMSSRILLASALSVGAASSAFATGVYAPYVDVTAWPTPAFDVIGVQQGIQQFTMAFVVAGNNQCVPSWGGVQNIGAGNTSDLLTSLSTSLTNYRAKGGEVSVSFGGANGEPLMQACTTAATLQSAYQTVIDSYAATHIDFDIEGGAQEDTAAITRNFQAVKALQSAMTAKGSTLHVTLTLPVMPTGLTQDGVNILNSAIANSVTFDAINVMAMDYGSASIEMGSAATQAATSLYSQLDTAYKAVGQTKTDAQLWQMVGITPMIGMNDVQGETFTLADAQTVLNVARTDDVGMLSNWSVGRDQSCPGNGAYTSSSCSGITQTPYAFAAIFRQINGHWGTGVTQDASYSGSAATGSAGSSSSGSSSGSSSSSGSGSSGSASSGSSGSTGTGSTGSSGTTTPANGAAWSSAQVYTAGMTVTYQGATYKAQWWTQGDVPGQAAVWTQLSGPLATWSSTMAYSGGTCVTYLNAKYCAQWWTQGDTPSKGGVWVQSN
ncbi:chitinase family 18 [Paraburkholderia fungorum]|uniref:Chitinase family 18 n=2 Tax=Paraburkholderia fungorum TaxID=134537 RepID=A0A1H1ITI3_9BURK|nr:chitinase [Paraburkholderia fungorum]SDR41041.1 chitinase family 18 [Paraburkholderia fungorum]